MAEHTDDKTHEPTQHRIEQARKEGQIPKSQDLSSAAILLAGVILFMVFGPTLLDVFLEITKSHLGGEAWLTTDLNSIMSHIWSLAAFLGKVILVFFGVMLGTAILFELGQVGFLFLPEKLSLDIQRINPIGGLKRLFSLNSTMRLLFGILKILIVAVIAYLSLSSKLFDFLSLSDTSVPQVASFMVNTTLETMLQIAILMFIIALLDYAYQRWKQKEDLKMTTQEIRDEMKSLVGDPQILARRKQTQRQLALARNAKAVLEADVVVTNPSEMAIALKYDESKMESPMVVGKGSGAIAKKIRRIALEQGIPIVEKNELAQALYRQVEVNQTTPVELYQAVAEVLAYVYQLKNKKPAA